MFPGRPLWMRRPAHWADVSENSARGARLELVFAAHPVELAHPVLQGRRRRTETQRHGGDARRVERRITEGGGDTQSRTTDGQRRRRRVEQQTTDDRTVTDRTVFHLRKGGGRLHGDGSHTRPNLRRRSARRPRQAAAPRHTHTNRRGAPRSPRAKPKPTSLSTGRSDDDPRAARLHIARAAAAAARAAARARAAVVVPLAARVEATVKTSAKKRTVRPSAARFLARVIIARSLARSIDREPHLGVGVLARVAEVVAAARRGREPGRGPPVAQVREPRDLLLDLGGEEARGATTSVPHGATRLMVVGGHERGDARRSVARRSSLQKP